MSADKPKVPHTLLQYVKNAKGRKVGMLTGFLDMPIRSVSIGWSRCHRLDKFDPKVGADFCLKNIGRPVPASLYRMARKFRVLCVAHFNDYVQSIQSVVPIPIRRMARTRKLDEIRNSGHRIGCHVRTLAGKRVDCICAKLAAEGKQFKPRGMP